ncbi:MAG: RHS repeat protein, partial [Micromonosporaceae bacterium]|nr:RHS repeat protein [Micromonosporaceae bacterium]
MYDDHGWLVSTRSPSGTVSSATYDAAGQVVTTPLAGWGRWSTPRLGFRRRTPTPPPRSWPGSS